MVHVTDSPAPELDALIGKEVAAVFLSIRPRTLDKWRVEGSGPKYVRISSRCIKYRRRDLIAWAEDRLRTSTSEVVSSN